MKRLILRMLDPSGATNGKVPVFNSTTSAWEPGDAPIDTAAEAERIRDVAGAALVAGSNVTITLSDPGDTITIAAAGGAGDLLMQDGVTAPPVPIETEARDDWLYSG